MRECDKIKGLFGAYLQNDVTSVERAAVENHIKTCEKCASDLQSRQKVLEKLKPISHPSEMSQRTQADFAWNVYKRIASDTMKHQSRRVFLRRFVLQPAFAGVALAAVLTVAVVQFHPGDESAPMPPSVAEADAASRKELRAEANVREFFQRRGMPLERESDYAMTYDSPVVESVPSDTAHLIQDALLSDSRRRLEYASFIDYSVGDRDRALAEYHQLVDYYPGTDVAVEARGRIRAILGARDADEEQITDTGI